MKKTLIFTLVAAPLCLLVRLFSQIYIIDQNGYFTYTGLLGAALRYSLWALFGAGVIFAFCLGLCKDKQIADQNSGVGGTGAAILSVVLSALLFLDAGLRLGQSIVVKKLDVLGVAAFVFAFYCAVLSIELFHKKPSGKATLILGIFAPLAIVCRAIIMFFDSFKIVNKSDTKLGLLTVCMLALFVTALVLSRAGATITIQRFKAVCELFCLVSFAYAVPSAYVIIKNGQVMQNISELLFIAQLIVLGLLSLTALIRLTYYKPKRLEVEQPVVQPELDLFINEIPEQLSEESDQ